MDKNSKLEVKTSLKIQKPLREVFEAIADPVKLSTYFLAKSTGRIQEGKTLTWQFPESEKTFPVRIDKVEDDKFLSWYWGDPDEKVDTKVEISLKPMEDGVLVDITEAGRDNDEAGIKWLVRNAAGWANFLACLKAYLEYGINLRKGAFSAAHIQKKVA